MLKTFPRNLMIVEYTESYVPLKHCTDKVVMFNSTIISESEVRFLIEQGRLEDSHDPRVVVMTRQQYKNLYDLDKKAAADKVFYEDLIREQEETG